ncbi:MAG: hypothetical protein N4A43_00740 [Alphaproteobacteria bacterium]|jgi:hypothetical protein|nr:hypothetical protein [Alphaproteobacteria bacterium]
MKKILKNIFAIIVFFTILFFITIFIIAVKTPYEGESRSFCTSDGGCWNHYENKCEWQDQGKCIKNDKDAKEDFKANTKGRREVLWK